MQVGSSLSSSDILFLFLLLGIPGILLLLIIFQHVLGSILAKGYDPDYFKPPYFTDGEIAVYSSWPLCLLRYATYIIYSGFPKLLFLRRFKGHSSSYVPGRLVIAISRIWVICLLLCIVSVPVIIILLV